MNARSEPKNHPLRQWDGPLTRELLLTPGKFGLGQVPSNMAPDQTTTVVCGYCSTGCGLKVHLREGEVVNLSPDTNYPVNLGMACPKGWEALNVLTADDRATTPLLREDIDRPFAACSWERALDTFTSRFKRIIQQHGTESVAFLSTGQIPTEEMLFLGCLAKFGMGWKYGDSNTRQCMATAATAYKQSFGFDAPPFTYEDFEESDLLIFVGANPCVGHPIMWERVLRNRRGGKIVTVDPRRTETAQASHLHLPIQPKSDQSLFYGLANLLIQRGWIDQAYIAAHVNGFEEYARFVAQFPLARVAEETGLSIATIEAFAEQIHAAERVSWWWTMGVNQSYQGVRTAQSLINLALLTGNIGRPGTGANSITGQCNAMGSRMFSNTSSLACGREFTNPEHRREVAERLQIDPSLIPAENSICYDEILDRVRDGQIRGLWVIATNTAHSWLDQAATREALRRLDFLVVQDMYRSTETAQLAHLILPAAGWGEKEGTFINSERRFGLLKRVSRAPGQALADLAIFRLIAQRWGCGEMFADWTSAAAVFEKMKLLSEGRPCDITGIADYEHLDRCDGLQWPVPAGSKQVAPQRRLFEDGKYHHPDGKAKLLFDLPQPLPEPPCESYPFVLLSGRGTVSQWHTQTRTAKSAVLRKLYPREIYVEIHPIDASNLQITHGERVALTSRRGELIARACIMPTVQPGQLFLPMHYAETNRLTLPHFDPHSRQPSYKDCAVRLERLKTEGD